MDRLAGAESLEKLHALFADFYAGQAMVKVRSLGQPEDGFLGANNMAGRDDMEIFITGSADQALCIARFDNLGKGASGAAVQCMNIVLGLDPVTGLEL